MGESILHWEDGQPWGKTNSVAAACISDMAGVDKRNRMARRSFPFCLLLTTLSNLSHGVGNEGLVAREGGATLELVGSVELGPLLAQLECMLTSSQGCMLGEKLAAYGIFFF